VTQASLASGGLEIVTLARNTNERSNTVGQLDGSLHSLIHRALSGPRNSARPGTSGLLSFAAESDRNTLSRRGMSARWQRLSDWKTDSADDRADERHVASTTRPAKPVHPRNKSANRTPPSTGLVQPWVQSDSYLASATPFIVGVILFRRSQTAT